MNATDTARAHVEFDDPASVAAEIAALHTPMLLVCDCDGVLAPLVDHADDSRLLDGIGELLRSLSTLPSASDDEQDFSVAVLSGRSLDGLAQFEFPDGVIVVGSYGGERRNRAPSPLDDAETDRLASLVAAADRACVIAGDGAWVEHKPASVVLHVRTADPVTGQRALDVLADAHASIPGSAAHHGSNVLELMARPTDKGSALDQLRRDESAAAVVYLGDDIPDEDAFAVLGDGDLSIKVGPGQTRADRRLESSLAVRKLLTELLQLRR